MTDWQPNDLALCVAPEGWEHAITGGDFPPGVACPRSGGIYTVSDVLDHPDGLWLAFEDMPRIAFIATAFRKIHPLTDAEKRTAVMELRAHEQLADKRAKEAAK